MKILLIWLLMISSVFADDGAPVTKGNSFNPDIGLNGLFLYRNSSRGSDPSATDRNGFGLSEAELQFTSDVDPYVRAVANFALEKNSMTEEWEFSPEEVYGETIGLPLITVRFGLFDALINKHNVLHGHAYPFLDPPLINTDLLGDEGLRESGVSVSTLLPTDWFLELTLQAFGGESKELFASDSPDDAAGLAYLDTLFDLRYDFTLQVGTSYTHGQNQYGAPTSVLGADLAFKWKPIGHDKIRTLKWVTQYLSGDRDLGGSALKRNLGGASYIQWQFDPRWWAQVRTDYTEERLGSDVVLVKRKTSLLAAFNPSEFSSYRLQTDQLEDGREPIERRVLVQLNWSIGAHPAHNY